MKKYGKIKRTIRILLTVATIAALSGCTYQGRFGTYTFVTKLNVLPFNLGGKVTPADPVQEPALVSAVPFRRTLEK